MQFTITDTGATQIEFQGNKLMFPMVAPKKSALIASDTPMVFEELNGFLNYLEIRHPGSQRLLFDSYKRIDQIFLSYADDIRSLIMAEIEYIYSIITMERIQEFLQYHCHIILPSTLQLDDLEEEEPIKEINQDMTYTTADYKGLVRLSLICRPMLPVWGRYIKDFGGVGGRTMVEFDCLKLLSNTHIVQSDEFDRLVVYVEAASNKALMVRDGGGKRSDVRENMIIRSMGTDGSHEWILSELLIRVLTICSLHAGEKVDLIRNVWNKVKQKVSKPPKSKHVVVNKFRDNEVVSDEKEPTSRIDQYRTSTTLSEGIISSWNYYCEAHGPDGFYGLVWAIDPEVPKELIDLVRNNNQHIRVLNITDFHMTILKWVQNKAISTAAIDVLNRPSVTNLLTATQCILIHWNFNALAFMLGSNYNGQLDVLEGTKSEDLPIEVVQQLESIYRYPLPRVGAKNAKPRNQAIVSIKRVVEPIIGQRWVGPWYDGIELGYTLDHHNRLMTPTNIREMLARLIIKLMKTS